jgi:hypothetical protein
MNRFNKGKFALAGILITIAGQGIATTIYSENFDSGTPGESLTDSPFGYTLHDTHGGGGDLKLGLAVHGWSGNSVIGGDADFDQLNYVYKFLPIPEHGLIQFSADFYSPTLVGSETQDVGMMLSHNAPFTDGYSNVGLFSVGPGWLTEDDSSGGQAGNVWQSPPGLHNEAVRGSLFWNQDTGEHWVEIAGESGTYTSPHTYYPTSPMNCIAIYIDRRNSNPLSGDIDNVDVEAVPEPITLSMGVGVLGLVLRRKRPKTQ